MRIIRRSSLTPTPWKNGGGVTHEIIRNPGDGSSFLWRVSLAYIESSGPFSDFAGYDRKMVLLRGAGVCLTFEGGQQTTLRKVGEMAQFDGGVPADCQLLGEPCADLNLMVSRSIPTVASVQPLRDPRELRPLLETILVFVVSGALTVEPDTGAAVQLHSWDLAMITPGVGGIARPASPSESDAPLVFVATLRDH